MGWRKVGFDGAVFSGSQDLGTGFQRVAHGLVSNSSISAMAWALSWKWTAWGLLSVAWYQPTHAKNVPEGRAKRAVRSAQDRCLVHQETRPPRTP